MRTRPITPTKNLRAAIYRLDRAAQANRLMAMGGLDYGGSIAADILAVLRALESAPSAGARITKTEGSQAVGSATDPSSSTAISLGGQEPRR
jgi:hypothetical protein